MKKEYKSQLSPEAREKYNSYCKEYLREWRRKNPDKVRQYLTNYWNKKATSLVEDAE